MRTALALGLIAAGLFSTTFVLNRAVHLGGGAWEWTASLRFLLALPALTAVVALRGGLPATLAALRARPRAWTVWSTIGFGLFYAPVTFATTAGPGWLVAATWQVTILAGVLLGPWLDGDRRAVIPRPAVAAGVVVLAGVALVQVEHAGRVGGAALVAGVVPVLVGAVAYPAGNRRTMQLAGGALGPGQRLLAMTVASLPCWIVLSAVGHARAGWPGADQVGHAAVATLAGGLLATALFFAATQRVRHHPGRLAAVESTQAAEVPAAAGLEALALGGGLPAATGWAGVGLIVAGIATSARAAARHEPRDGR